MGIDQPVIKFTRQLLFYAELNKHKKEPIFIFHRIITMTDVFYMKHSVETCIRIYNQR